MTTVSPWWRSLIAVLLAVAPVEVAEAAVITVTCASSECFDFGCGLSDAIVNHNHQDKEGAPDCASGTEDDEIVFDIPATPIPTYAFTLPPIKNKLKISGAGIRLHDAYLEVTSGATLTLSQLGLSVRNGQRLSFIFVNPGGTLNLIGGTYSNLGGMGPGAGGPEIGGVIYNKGGVVNIAPVDGVRCNSVPRGCPSFSHNTATRAGGAIYNDGGEVHIVGTNPFGGDPTQFTQNTAPDGGAIYNNGGKVFITAGVQVGGDQAGNQAQRGGGIYSANGGVVIVTDSDVEGNLATSTDPLTGGGGIFVNGTPVTIERSNVVGNRAAYEGGGVFVQDAVLTVRDTTFTGNVAGGAQKPGLGGAVFVNTQKTSQSASVAGSTFFENQAAESGSMIFFETGTGVLDVTNSTLAGIFRQPELGEQFAVILYGGTGRVAFSTLVDSGVIPAVGQRGRASIHLRGTILSGAVCTAGTNGIVDSGHNLQWPGHDCPASIPVLDPRLGAGPQDYGGPTKTIPPTSGSAAIAAIPVAECTDHDGARVTTDQRGFARPAGGDRCAIGAVEVGAGVAGAAATRATLTVFKDAVRAGDLLTFGVDASIAAGGGSLELHVGVLYPDGDTLVLLNQDGGVERYTSLRAPAPVAPVAVLAGGETLHRPAFGRFDIPATGLPAGTYQLFAVLTRAGALQDAHIAPAEIVATDVKPIVYTP